MDLFTKINDYYIHNGYKTCYAASPKENILFLYKAQPQVKILGILQTVDNSQFDLGYLENIGTETQLLCQELFNMDKMPISKLIERTDKINEKLDSLVNMPYWDIRMCPKVIFEDPEEEIKKFLKANGFMII